MIDEHPVFRAKALRRAAVGRTGIVREAEAVARDDGADDADPGHLLRDGLGVWLERAIRRTFLYSFDG